MREGAFLNISFEPQLIKSPNLVYWYKQGQSFTKVFCTILRPGDKFQVLFSLATCSSYSVTNYIKIPVFHLFWKDEKEAFRNVKYQLLKMARSHYTVILIRSWKGLEPISSLQHWAKSMSEMCIMQHTSIWPNFILIVLRIQ